MAQRWDNVKRGRGALAYILEFIEKPVRVNLTLLGLMVVFVFAVSVDHYINNFETLWIQVIGEFHGVLADVAILGIMFEYLNRVRDRNSKITQLKEEIEDHRYWRSQESGFKAVGNLRRLNRLGVVQFDLNHYYLLKTSLRYMTVNDSYFCRVNMMKAQIAHTEMRSCTIADAQCKAITILDSDLSGLYAANVNFRFGRFTGVKMNTSCITNSNFGEAYLKDVSMSGSILIGTTFKGATLENVNLENCLGLTVEMLLETARLDNCRIDPELQVAYKIIKSAASSKPDSEPGQLVLSLSQR